MLNKQGPRKIDWTDYTWNPIAGCLHGCDYCYMRRMEKRFPGMMTPKWRPKYLEDIHKNRLKLKAGSKIFVGSSGDMWGKWVPSHQIELVLGVIRDYPRYLFQFLTKNPGRYAEFDLPRNGWYGTTDDGTDKTKHNITHLNNIVRGRIRFVSFEPLLEKIDVWLGMTDWIIIGANSNKGARKPPDEWADEIIDEARYRKCAVWVKDNYGYHTRIKEWPNAVTTPNM